MSLHFLKIFSVYLLADNLSSNKVFFCQAKPHLLQYKLNFFLLFHRPKRLHLLTNTSNTHTTLTASTWFTTEHRCVLWNCSPRILKRRQFGWNTNNNNFLQCNTCLGEMLEQVHISCRRLCWKMTKCGVHLLWLAVSSHELLTAPCTSLFKKAQTNLN